MPEYFKLATPHNWVYKVQNVYWASPSVPYSEGRLLWCNSRAPSGKPEDYRNLQIMENCRLWADTCNYSVWLLAGSRWAGTKKDSRQLPPILCASSVIVVTNSLQKSEANTPTTCSWCHASSRLHFGSRMPGVTSGGAMQQQFIIF